MACERLSVRASPDNLRRRVPNATFSAGSSLTASDAEIRAFVSTAILNAVLTDGPPPEPQDHEL